ncbi:MAG: chemotaxis protein CheB [Sedimenticola sp.]
MRDNGYKAIVIGASAGGMAAITSVLKPLPCNYGIPILMVQHLHHSDRGGFAQTIDTKLALSVCQAADKEQLLAGHVYFAPANYHMLVEHEETLALSVDELVNWSRPSIDVLFESAARIWKQHLVGIILTGANEDGAQGLQRIAQQGGLTIVQNPESAESPEMPSAAMKRARIDHLLLPNEIGTLLQGLEPFQKAAAEKANGPYLGGWQ